MRVVAVLVAFLALVPAADAAVTETQIRVPMRDGVELAVDLYLPDEAQGGGKVPVILTLTPYHVLYKGLGDAKSLDGYRFTADGYAFAVADVRGTYESGGCWDYGGLHERQDGYDLVEWLGTQPWSNGKVGMIGGSYDGTTANAAAVEQPPHLATIVPISSISRWYGYAYDHGVRRTYSGESADEDPPGDTPTDFMFAYGFLPPPEGGAPLAAEQIAQRWTPCDRAGQIQHGYSTQPDYDDFWVQRDYLRLADRVNVPVLVAHGLQDYNVNTWEGTQFYEALKVPKAMVFGQWQHAIPPWDGWDDLLDAWFARWLKDEHNGVENLPPINVQSTDGEFRTRSQWAGDGLRSVVLGNEDVDIFDDGALTESEMLRDACGSRCVRLQLPGLGGAHIEGRPKLSLRLTSDQVSTHVVAILLDVAPDGSSSVISRAFANARYRDGLEKGVDLEPGKPTTVPLEFIDKDHIVAPDHRVDLILASSSATWVLSDENRATNVFALGQSRLDVPTDDPGPPAPPAVAPPPVAPAAPAPERCARRFVVRRPRGARHLRVRVNGRRVAVRRGRVKLPRTRTGRGVVRVEFRLRGRHVVRVRRVPSCSAGRG